MYYRVYDKALSLNKAYLIFFTIWPLNEKLVCGAKILRVEMFILTIRGNSWRSNISRSGQFKPVLNTVLKVLNNSSTSVKRKKRKKIIIKAPSGVYQSHICTKSII